MQVHPTVFNHLPENLGGEALTDVEILSHFSRATWPVFYQILPQLVLAIMHGSGVIWGAVTSVDTGESSLLYEAAKQFLCHGGSDIQCFHGGSNSGIAFLLTVFITVFAIALFLT